MNTDHDGHHTAVTVLHMSLPPSDAVEQDRWVLATPDQLGGFRAALHKALTGKVLNQCQNLDDIPEKVVLVASELATNAMRHGLPPTEVRLLDNGDRVILDVSDGDLDAVPEVEHPGPTATGGRGLQIAQLLSLNVAWYTTGRTKHIWAAFPRSE
jgi:anti-sigma regulatory factor (Ser/Thr protein kinase)